MNKSKIHIDNYEEYALDFLEKNLSPEMHKSFELFLDFHPDIQAELSDLLDYTLERPALTFNEKETLKYRGGFYMGSTYRILSLAAAILLLFTFIFLINRPDASLVDEIIVTETNDQTQEKESIIDQSIDVANIASEESTQQPKSHSTYSAEKELKHSHSTNEIMGHDKMAASTNKNRATETNMNKYVGQTDQEDNSNYDNLIAVNDPKEDLTTSNNISIHEIQTTNDITTINNERDITDVGATINSNRGAHERGDLDIVSATSQIQNRVQDELLTLPTPPVVALATTVQEDQGLFNRIPQLAYKPVDDGRGIVFVSGGEVLNKKRKLSLRNFIPEQIAGLSGDEIKESLIPEAIISR